MATPQLSPGVLVREVDLTVGRAENVLDNIGAIAGPFAIGPIEDPIDITTEEELIKTFGKPLSTDAQYEYWMTASSYLTYGGILKVVRVDDDDLKTANAGVGIANTTTLKIKNYDDYINNYTEATNYTYAAKNPGRYANDLKVCWIDDKSDQIIGITTTDLNNAGARIGFGVTTVLSGQVVAGLGTTSAFSGYMKGIITGVKTDATGGQSTIEVKIVSQVETVGVGTTETKIEYAEGNAARSFSTSDSLFFVNNAGINTGLSADAAYTPRTIQDWYDQQTLGLTNTTIFWKELAPRPTTNVYVDERDGHNDGAHVVIVDDKGTVSGIRGNLLEKHLGLSKAFDTVSSVNSPQKTWYENYLADFSEYVYAGGNPSNAFDAYHGTNPVATGFSTYSGDKSTAFVPVSTGDGLWGQNAQGVTFAAIGNTSYTLKGGEDYSTYGGMKAELGPTITAYGLFSNKDEIQVDYLIMGPGCTSEAESQAKANYLISVANSRKDCVATVGAHRGNVVNVTNPDTQTNNLVNYFSSLQSSSYAVFDSGYKYNLSQTPRRMKTAVN